MKYVMMLLSIFVLISCSSNGKKQTWDDGAQKQEAITEEQRYNDQEVLRNQFPGGRPY